MTKPLRIIHDFLVRSRYLVLLIPVAAAVAVYVQTLAFEPTNWDDELFIYNSPYVQKITFENVKSLLTPGNTEEDKLYLPITYLTNLIEFQLYSNKSWGVHFDNLILHLINIWLVFAFVSSIVKDRLVAFSACFLFAVHPLQCEVVAWSMGRKDLLMTMMSLLSMLSFVDFLNTGSRKAYISSLIFLFLSVFSKPSAFVVPLMLLALCWYFGKKIDRDMFLRLIPFFAISSVVCILNSALEFNSYGYDIKYVLFRLLFVPAIAADWLMRILLLERPYAYYSWYEYCDGSRISLLPYLLFAFILGVTAYAFARKRKVLFTCLAFSLFGFIPAFVLVAFSFRDFVTADRYGYFPLIGVFMLASSSFLVFENRIFKAILAGVFLLVIVLCSFRSYMQASTWRNSEILWSSVIKAEPCSFIAHYNLGNYYFKKKYDLKSAEYNYRRANSITPDSDSWYNIGIICELTDRKHESDICYLRAVSLNPDSAYAVRKVALSYYSKGEMDRALDMFIKLANISPSSSEAYLYCGRIFQGRGDKDGALRAFELYERLKRQGY